MNAHPHRPIAVDDAAELARLMPAPAVPELGDDRKWMLSEQLMRQLREPPAGTPAPERPRPARRRILWGLAPLTAVAATVVTVLAIGALSASPPGSVRSNEASPLLERLALAAEHQPANAVRGDQYVYVKSLVAFANFIQDDSRRVTVTFDIPHERQVWLSVDGRRAGQLVENGARDTLEAYSTPSLNVPTYRYLAVLPTDPDKLLRKIYAETGSAGNSPEQEAFVTIGDLLRESIAPPEVTAALYRAAAKIPGVFVVDDVTDAAGRHGIAVARLDKKSGAQQEWIFDNSASTYLGERDVQVTRSPEGVAPGTVLGQAAILTRAVVDRVGQTG